MSTAVADPAFISYCPAFDVPCLSNVSCFRIWYFVVVARALDALG